ncbi:uncharacterized protein LOC118231321 isoform X1 [Anguilla anguilla]|uniref:uncharacterized protein LOC118231321 isoform X1 n=1 Tax=Anguilla anguilla TaxID=7936 RepID=UPI0015ACB072|nr:uncharacterized protein LOC118231321 isoform X1 [Anguilla anguilla]
MAEMRRGNFRVVQYRRAPVWRSTGRGTLGGRGLSGRLGGHWSYRGLWGGNRLLQHLDRAGHPALSPPALSTDAAPPSYLSFVSGAVLWDRGLYHYADSSPTDGSTCLCHRFLAHMNTSPGDVRLAHIPSSHPRPMLPHLGLTQRRQALSEPRRQALSDPRVRRYTDPRRGLQLWSSKRLQWDIGEPCMPSSPPPSRASPDPPVSPSSSSHTARAGHQATMPPAQAHPPPPAPSLARTTGLHQEDEDRKDGNLCASSAAAGSPGWDQRPGSEFQEAVTPVSLVTPVTPETLDLDLSDFSRPPSSQLSQNSDFSSRRSSVLSGGFRSSSLCLSTPASLSSSLVPLPDHPLDPLQTLRRSSLMLAPGNHGDRDRFSLSRPEQDSLVLDPQGRPARPGVTPPSTLLGQMSRCWPVLPPISPHRGASETGGSSSSQVSSTESDVLEELDAIAYRTGSCLSQERSNSFNADCSSPDTAVLSHRADSLVLDCDSGSLGSLSRVRLLLLDHPDAVEPFSPVPECGFPSTDSMGDQNEHAGGTYRMHRGDWSTVSSSLRVLSGSLAPLTPAGCGEGAGLKGRGTSGAEGQSSQPAASSGDRASQPSSCLQESFLSDSALTVGSGSASCQSKGFSGALEAPEAEKLHTDPGCQGSEGSAKQRRASWKLEHLLQEKRRMDTERKAKVSHIYSKLKEHETAQRQTNGSHSRFEDFDFLAKYCIFNQEKLSQYKQAFEAVDSDGDGYLTCYQVLLALKEIAPPEVLTDSEEIYVYRILEMVDFRVTEGLTDLRLFAVVASLAQKIASLDDFTRSLIGKLDFRTVEMKLYRAKQLFLFLLETQTGVSAAQEGLLSTEQLLMELRAGGIAPEHEEVVASQLRHVKSLDLLDFLAHLPLFLLIHSSVIANPLDDTRSL